VTLIDFESDFVLNCVMRQHVWSSEPFAIEHVVSADRLSILAKTYDFKIVMLSRAKNSEKDETISAIILHVYS